MIPDRGKPGTRHDSNHRVGKTHLATALGHIAIRRRRTVHAARADKLFTRLRAARLDNTLDADIRRLARVDVLILDDFALKTL
ncbi:MAG: ATP-binding protein, partial [Rhodospirillales bacterium]